MDQSVARKINSNAMGRSGLKYNFKSVARETLSSKLRGYCGEFGGIGIWNAGNSR